MSNDFNFDNGGYVPTNDFKFGGVIWEAGITSTFGINEQSGFALTYDVGIQSILGINDSHFGENAGNLITIIPPSVVYTFYLTLTGANDSLEDYEITQLKTVQFRLKRNGESSYIGVSAIYLQEAETEIDARPNGTLVLSMASKYQGFELLREDLFELDFSDVRYDIGSTSRSITINGYGALTYEWDIVFLLNAIQKRVNQDGRVNYRFTRPDFYVRPGYKVVYGLESFTVDEVAFYVGENEFYMDVYCEKNSLIGLNINDKIRIYSLETDRYRKFFATLTGSADGLSDVQLPFIESIELRLKSGGVASYLSITVMYSDELKDAIDERPNGDIVISVMDGPNASIEQFVVVNFNEISYSILSDKRTATLVGYKQIGFSSNDGENYSPSQIISERVLNDGSFYLKSVNVNVDLRPGWTCLYGGKEYRVGDVTMIFQPTFESVEFYNGITLETDDELLSEVGLNAVIGTNAFNYPESPNGFGTTIASRVSINGVEIAYHDESNLAFMCETFCEKL